MYNLIRKGDHVTTSTFRKITRDSGAGTSSDRLRVKLTVQVEDVDFDPEGTPALTAGQHNKAQDSHSDMQSCSWQPSDHQSEIPLHLQTITNS